MIERIQKWFQRSKPEPEATPRELAVKAVETIEDLYVQANEAILIGAEGSALPNRQNGQLAIDLMSVFLFGGELPSDVYLSRPLSKGLGDFSYPEKILPGLESREYNYEPTGLVHRPLAPRSATYRPRGLSDVEKTAVELAELFQGVALTPKLKAKLKEFQKGERRVVFDASGKMKEVKTK